MHHFHMSGAALFILLLFAFAVLALFLAFLSSLFGHRDPSASAPVTNRPYSAPRAFGAAAPVYVAAPTMAPVYGGYGPGYGAGDAAFGLAAGVMIGEAIGHHHDTVVYSDGIGDVGYSDSYGGDDGGIDIDFGGD